jgi:hypothetical protein
MARPVLRRIHRSMAVVDVPKAHALQHACAGYPVPAWHVAAANHPSGSGETAWTAPTVSLYMRVLRRARNSCPLSAARRLRPLPLLLPSMLPR